MQNEVIQLKISQKTKDLILNNLLKEDIFINFFKNREELLNFLSDALPLYKMSSEDPRHTNAFEDLSRHLVMNDDWTIEYLFKERLKINNTPDLYFIKFIEMFIYPKYQDRINVIYYLVTFFNSFLDKENLKLILTGYENNLPIFKIDSESGVIKNIPKNVKKNDIPFFVEISRGHPDKFNNHNKPKVFPSFVLVKDSWNDFNATTLHHLFFYKNIQEVDYLGFTKIMKRGEESTDLPGNFFLLDENYCSLGNSKKFYEDLESKTKENFISVLFALRDAAFFPMIYEEFENDLIFNKSLIRNDTSERNSRTISYSFAGGELSQRYKFKYKFKPKFAEEDTEISFPFMSESLIPKRIIALIGKNGTGKTQLLTSLAENLSDKNSSLFSPRTPEFGKILAVSYSIFDTFKIPKSDNSFNYKYCGLKNTSGGLLTDSDLEIRFYTSLEKIKERNRVSDLRDILKKFIEEYLIDSLIEDENRDRLIIKKERYPEIKSKLSSGQCVLMYIIVEILAELRFDSLILFDEPETHLHPNAITELISVINELLQRFDSYCIIATHSPIIIQSITSDSVYVTEKIGTEFLIRKIQRESFGENLSNITDEIFGNVNTHNEYKKIIESLIRDGKTYMEIISLLETDGVPLSLNAKIYIQSVLKN